MSNVDNTNAGNTTASYSVTSYQLMSQFVYNNEHICIAQNKNPQMFSSGTGSPGWSGP